MKVLSEQQIQNKIVKHLESKGCYVVKVVKANKSGVPDVLFCMDGKFCAIEVKAKGKKNNATELQKLHLNMIQQSGGKAIVADCVEDVEREFI